MKVIDLAIYRKARVSFSESQEGNGRYDGHINFEVFWPNANPDYEYALADSQIKSAIEKFKIQTGQTVYFTGFGTWEKFSIMYIKKKDVKKYSEIMCRLLKEELITADISA